MQLREESTTLTSRVDKLNKARVVLAEGKSTRFDKAMAKLSQVKNTTGLFKDPATVLAFPAAITTELILAGHDIFYEENPEGQWRNIESIEAKVNFIETKTGWNLQVEYIGYDTEGNPFLRTQTEQIPIPDPDIWGNECTEKQP